MLSLADLVQFPEEVVGVVLVEVDLRPKAEEPAGREVVVRRSFNIPASPARVVP